MMNGLGTGGHEVGENDTTVGRLDEAPEHSTTDGVRVNGNLLSEKEATQWQRLLR